MTRVMPKQKPGRSEQSVSTPLEFMEAVIKRFCLIHSEPKQKIDFDLAADKKNRKAKLFYSETDNSLKKDWRKLTGNLWLNPPYNNIEQWARKCNVSISYDGEYRRIMLLTSASVGSNWFLKYVYNRADVFVLNVRIKFDGHSHMYPKDLMLSVFDNEPRSYTNIKIWDWKNDIIY